MSMPPARSSNLAAHVAEQIRQQILNGELPPGHRLSEAALSETHAVSRNTLREIFRMLTKEGLLTHEPNRGVSVALPSIMAIIDLYRIRRLIECQVIAQADPRHPAAKRLRTAVDTGLRCRKQGDWNGAGMANLEFHLALVELADSERLNALIVHLMTELRLVMGLMSHREFMLAPFMDWNAKIADLFEAGKPQEASAALHDLLVHAERTVLAEYARHIPDRRK